jgi:hypothetical protein
VGRPTAPESAVAAPRGYVPSAGIPSDNQASKSRAEIALLKAGARAWVDAAKAEVEAMIPGTRPV